MRYMPEAVSNMLALDTPPCWAPLAIVLQLLPVVPAPIQTRLTQFPTPTQSGHVRVAACSMSRKSENDFLYAASSEGASGGPAEHWWHPSSFQQSAKTYTGRPHHSHHAIWKTVSAMPCAGSFSYQTHCPLHARCATLLGCLCTVDSARLCHAVVGSLLVHGHPWHICNCATTRHRKSEGFKEGFSGNVLCRVHIASNLELSTEVLRCASCS